MLSLVRNLVAYPYVNRSRLRIYGKNTRVRLQIGLMNVLRRKRVLENLIRLAKSLFDIAYAPRIVGVDVVDRRGKFWEAFVIVQPLMKLGGTLGDRNKRIEDCRQLFILDLDELNRFFCKIPVLGRYHCYLLADETDTIPGQHRHVSQSTTGQYVRNIGRCENCHDPRLRCCS